LKSILASNTSEKHSINTAHDLFKKKELARKDSTWMTDHKLKINSNTGFTGHITTSRNACSWYSSHLNLNTSSQNYSIMNSSQKMYKAWQTFNILTYLPLEVTESDAVS
jgi:hypothetical protein